METKQLFDCANWFNSRGIKAHTDGESVKILVEGHWVFVSSSEVEYRAELYSEENP